MQRPYNFPPLNDLACFESAARHRSFKKAASELNVTPAAVSHRIKSLERELGQPLFSRQFRGVELTEAGALLFVSLQRGFGIIGDSVARIRSRHVRTGVSVAATSAMSTLWLLPRLAAYWKLHPEVAISQIAQDSGRAEGADLSIHYGDPETEQDEAIVLFRGRVLALGNKAFVETHDIRDLSDMSRVPLIHTRSDANGWTTWRDWFAHMDMPEPQGPAFHLNNYLVSLKAAEDGIGAVLGWEGMLQGYLASERLVPLVPEAMLSPFPFYMRVQSSASSNARRLAEWLAVQTTEG